MENEREIDKLIEKEKTPEIPNVVANSFSADIFKQPIPETPKQQQTSSESNPLDLLYKNIQLKEQETGKRFLFPSEIQAMKEKESNIGLQCLNTVKEEPALSTDASQSSDIQTQKEKATKRKRIIKTEKSIIETPNFDFIEANEIRIEEEKKHKRVKNFRLRLASIVYLLIFVICTGWCIGNALSLNSTNAELAKAISETTYQINEVQYIVKIEQLDGFQDIKNGDATLITSIVEVTPPALVQPTEIQPQTNWFDRLCDWVKGIFGG